MMIYIWWLWYDEQLKGKHCTHHTWQVKAPWDVDYDNKYDEDNNGHHMWSYKKQNNT